jgi:hypothetical protein
MTYDKRLWSRSVTKSFEKFKKNAHFDSLWDISYHISVKYVRGQNHLRGGWAVTAEECKSLGFTIGLPPSLYVPQTTKIVEESQRFEACDSVLLAIDISFSVRDTNSLFECGRTLRC